MRRHIILVVVVMVVLLAQAADAQVLQSQMPAPEVTAATAPWQINNEVIVVSGLAYYPTREMRMFDSQVMAQIDVYQGVPIYADLSLQPFTVVYVPLSRDRMRTYERPHDPNFAAISGRGSVVPSAGVSAAIEEQRPVGTAGMIAAPTPIRSAVPEQRRMRSPVMARQSGGVWVPFAGSRWYNDGPAVSHSPDRFVQVGSYHGFPVYRDRSGPADRIWIPAVEGGLLTPYAKR
jgi:hypothetical protein